MTGRLALPSSCADRRRNDGRTRERRHEEIYQSQHHFFSSLLVLLPWLGVDGGRSKTRVCAQWARDTWSAATFH